MRCMSLHSPLAVTVEDIGSKSYVPPPAGRGLAEIDDAL